MSKQKIIARLRKRLATLTPEARAERLRMLTRRVEMDQREIAFLKEVRSTADRLAIDDETEKEVLTFRNAASRLSPPAPEKHHVPKSR